jgi:hypothetical protein
MQRNDIRHISDILDMNAVNNVVRAVPEPFRTRFSGRKSRSFRAVICL